MTQPALNMRGEEERGVAPHTGGKIASAFPLLVKLDGSIERRVLVSGRLPPEGRDTDLIVRRREREIIREVLAGTGFLPRGRAAVPKRRRTEQWARFVECGVEIVDLNPAERWGLADEALARLFDEAVPIRNLQHFATPSPAHSILLLGRRLVSEGVLNSERLSRIPELVRRDPDAWKRAAALATDWRVNEALHRLHKGWVGGDERITFQRSRSIGGLLSQASTRSLVSGAVAEANARRPRPAKVVAFSGLDGSGKTTQVVALKRTLDSLGVDAVVEWKPLGHNASVRLLRRAAKRVVAQARGIRVSELDNLKAPGRSLVAGPQPALLRSQNALLTHVWATVVALASAAHYRGVVLRSFGTGRVVLFDRYALDTMAQLRFFYGERRAFPIQRLLVKAICPKPIFAVLLEIPASTALSRKPEQYDLAQLEAQARLLHAECTAFGVQTTAGTRPIEDICESVARSVWERLR